MAYDDDRQRLPRYEDTEEYQRLFAGQRVEPDERRTKHGIPDELGEDLDALARDFIAKQGR